MKRLSIALGLSLVAACSSGGSSNPDAGPTGSGSGSFVDRYCADLAPCCEKAGKPTTGTACRALFGFGFVGIDQAAADKCLADLEASKSKPDYCEKWISPDSCSAVLKPGKPDGAKPGEACTQDNDCAPQTEGRTRCAMGSVGGATVQKCQVVVVGKAGDSPCVGNVTGPATIWRSFGDPPEKGFSCNLDTGLHCDTTSQECRPLGKAGESCLGSGDCEPDLYCASSTCAARIPLGSACSSDDSCARKSWCHAGTCEAQIPLGGACTDSRACDDGACDGGTCKSNDLGLALLCGG